MERDPIAEALGLTPEKLEEMDKRDREWEVGRDARVAKLLQNSAKGLEMARDEDPTYRAANAPKPIRRKRVVKAGERGWIESDFQREFKAWALKNGTSSAVFECKSTPSDSIPFDRLEPHQKDYLLTSKHRKTYYHPSDYANLMGIKQKLPCDGIMLVGVKAFVPIMFNVRQKGNRTFYLVDIDAWITEDRASERRSLTETRAGEIGKKCVL